MKTVWTKGLTPEQTVELKKDFVGAVILRKRLQELLDEKARLSREASISKDAYTNPNWAYLQADARGYERALNEIVSLLEK
jgi:hypothetical protein